MIITLKHYDLFKHIADSIEPIDGEDDIFTLTGNEYCRKIYSLVVDRRELIRTVLTMDCSLYTYLDISTVEEQLFAIKKCSSTVICYISDPCEDVQLAAVDKSWVNISIILKTVKNPSNDVILLSIYKSRGSSIRFMINNGIKLSEEVLLVAVKNEGNVIRFIDNPSEEIQLAAVTQDINAINFIKNPTQRVKDYVNSQRALTNI